MAFELFIEIFESAIDQPDEVITGADVSADRRDRIAFGEIVRNNNYFPVIHQFRSDSLNDVIGSLAGF